MNFTEQKFEGVWERCFENIWLWERRKGRIRNKSVNIIAFYVYGSVHRWSVLITVQRDATQSSLFIILEVHSTCFECQPHPSSEVHKTVNTASGTGHIFVQLPPSNVANLGSLDRGTFTKIWSIPEALVTVLCTPDDGCGW